MTGLERAAAIQQQSNRPVSDRFVCEFRADFRGLGMSLDVDDEGRLVVQEVMEDGEASTFTDLQQSNLHIVTVGVDNKHPEFPADELLRRLMTLPRPVKVEFAVTIESPTAAAVNADAEAVGKSSRSQSLNAKPQHPISRVGSLADEGKVTADTALLPSHTSGPTSVKAPFVGEASKEHRRLPWGDAAPTIQTPTGLEDHPGMTSFPDGDTDQTNPLERSEDCGDAATGVIRPEEGAGHVDELWIDRHRGSDPRSHREGMLVGGTGWEESLRNGASMIGHGHHVDSNGDDEVDTSRHTREGFESDEAVRTQRVPKPVAATRQNRKMVEGSADVARTPDGSESSAHQWLQDDSDYSDGITDRVAHRYSWYTTNHMRRGHALDVRHVGSIARASALERVRKAKEESQNPWETKVATERRSAHGGVRVGVPKEAYVRDSRLTIYDWKGARESQPADSAEGEPRGQNDHCTAARDAAADAERPKFELQRGDAESDGPPVEQNTNKDERGACNPQRMPPKGGVSARKHRFPSQESTAGDQVAHDGDGASTREATTSAIAGGRKPRAGGGLATVAVPSSSSFNSVPGGVTIQMPRRSYSDRLASEAPRGSRGKSDWAGSERFGSADCGAVTTGVSSKHKGRSGQSNAPRRENASPPVTIPSQPLPDPSATKHTKGGVDEESTFHAVEGDISCLIQNHTPFMPGCSEDVGAVNEGAAGRGSFAATVEPLLRLSHADPPAAISFGNAPSSGPANPRAMYGRMPTPALAGTGVIRAPSVIVLPEKFSKDENGVPRSGSDAVRCGAGRSGRSVSGVWRSASRGDEVGSGRGGGGGVESEKVVGSTQVRPPYARDGVGYKVEKVELTERKTKAQGEARTLQAQVRLGGGGSSGRSRGDSCIGVADGGAAAARTRRSGSSSTTVRRGSHSNKVQRAACGLSTNADDDMPSSPSKTSWERQLRTGIGARNRPGTTAARPCKDDTKRPSGSCFGLGEASGDEKKKVQSVATINETRDSACKNSASARQTLASPSAEPVADARLATEPWSRLRVDVEHTPTRTGVMESTDRQASEGAEANRQKHNNHGSEAENDKQRENNERDCRKEEKEQGETTLDREESGRSASVRGKEASGTGNDGEIRRRFRSTSQESTRHAPRAVANAKAAAGAATTTAAVTVTAAVAAVAASAATASVTIASEGFWKGFPKGRTAANATEAPIFPATPTSADAEQKRSVARVRVRVRSSVYVVVAYLDESGSRLLDEVVEAEKHRHGVRAARVMGLTNQSTGNPVDLNVPARRSLSSGDTLTAVVVTMTSDGRGEAGSAALAESGSGKSPGRVGREDRPEVIRGEHTQPARSRPTRQRSISEETPTPPRMSVEDAERGGSHSPQRRSKPSRSIASPRDIDQLRDDVARQLLSERRAAGEGIGALCSPSRPLGSPPITPVTGGGRGASPENSRVTSPRSDSPRGALKGPGRSTEGGGGAGMGGSRPVSPARSARSVASGYTHYSGFSVRSHGRAARSERAFLAQSTLTPKELDGILKEELLKSRKWSARHRTAQDKVRRVWEERGLDHKRLQRAYEEKESARREEIRQRQEVEAHRMAARNRRLANLAESARQQARDSRDTKDSRAKEAEAIHRKRVQRITEQKDREKRELARKVQIMDQRREDVRDSFLNLVDIENETAIQALETPLEVLERAVGEGDSELEKKARRAILRRQARERVSLRQRAARVLADQRRRESVVEGSSRTRQEVESSMMPGPGQYNIRDFSEFGGGTYSRPLV